MTGTNIPGVHRRALESLTRGDYDKLREWKHSSPSIFLGRKSGMKVGMDLPSALSNMYWKRGGNGPLSFELFYLCKITSGLGLPVIDHAWLKPHR